MIASSLASRIVYREGLQYIEGLADATLPQLCATSLNASFVAQQLLVRARARARVTNPNPNLQH